MKTHLTHHSPLRHPPTYCVHQPFQCARIERISQHFDQRFEPISLIPKREQFPQIASDGIRMSPAIEPTCLKILVRQTRQTLVSRIVSMVSGVPSVAHSKQYPASSTARATGCSTALDGSRILNLNCVYSVDGFRRSHNCFSTLASIAGPLVRRRQSAPDKSQPGRPIWFCQDCIDFPVDDFAISPILCSGPNVLYKVRVPIVD